MKMKQNETGLKEGKKKKALYLWCHEAGVPSSVHIATGKGQFQS